MSRSTLRVVIAILTLITAAVHALVGIGSFQFPDGQAMGILFLLNAVGYVALLIVNMVDVPFFGQRKALAGYLLMGYAALTFVLYFVSNGFSFFGPLPIIAKVDELLLVIVGFIYLNTSE